MNLIITLTLQSREQGGEPDLAGVIVLRVEQITQLRQELRPGLQLSFRGYGRDQDTFMKDNKNKDISGPKNSGNLTHHRI